MSEVITHYQGRYLSLLERDGWEFASRANASGVVVIVAMTPAREIVLVEQFRKPVGGRVIELPAGLVGDHSDAEESVITAGKRELEEETGFTASRWEVLLACPSSAGMSDEIITFVLARDLIQTGPGGGDASEEIEVHTVPLDTAERWLQNRIDRGIALDPKVYTALYWLNQPDKRPAAR
ncbi:MAG: NUDIX hydrolase [Xanthomonadales bacterium]|nr:NUDIX hydrolase [Xanthomonadales bacterium]